jgi:hypothetical protein
MAPQFLSIMIQPVTWALSMTFFDDAMQAPLPPAGKEPKAINTACQHIEERRE